MKGNQREQAKDGGNNEIGHTTTDPHRYALQNLALSLKGFLPDINDLHEESLAFIVKRPGAGPV
ncbi:hypothetical protein AA102526_1822 [Asaia lannensis NBRC 102526]|nr:hypothetical protein AA102526_1822 [Asaia lannensis NBRC 102526]